MSLPTTSLDLPATSPDTTTARRLRSLLPTGMLAGAAAAAATVVVAASAQAADVSLEVDGTAIPLTAFAFWTIVATFAGAVLAAVVRHRRRFLAATLTLTALSIVPSIVAPDDTATTIVLVGTHLLAAAIIIPAISNRLPTEKAAQVDALIAGYQTGKTMKELAAEFGIDRRTVSAHLHRAEIATRWGGLDQEQTIETVRLYEAGWSSARLAQRFDVSADSVLKVLRRAGVAIRPRRGEPPSKWRRV